MCALVAAVYLPRLGAYSRWDPWEGHYAEVARRMREEHDWLRMRWQTETFYSKPPLTFWLMAGGMKLFGVGEDGGYSGELATSPRTEWALRLPFALFGIAAIAALWFLLARLTSRRVAWLAATVLATTPYYFFISSQAITDIPATALLVGTLVLFALAIQDDSYRPLAPRRYALYAFLVMFLAVVLAQLGAFVAYLGDSRLVVGSGRFLPGPLIMAPFAVGTLGVAFWVWRATKTTRQLLMYWFYLLSGLAVLAKGPVAPGLAGLTILVYLAATGEWRLLLKVEIPRGLLIAVAVCLPWHFAEFAKEGNPWLREYWNEHLINSAVKGVHGDRGTFLYFIEQLGELLNLVNEDGLGARTNLGERFLAETSGLFGKAQPDFVFEQVDGPRMRTELRLDEGALADLTGAEEQHRTWWQRETPMEHDAKLYGVLAAYATMLDRGCAGRSHFSFKASVGHRYEGLRCQRAGRYRYR